MLAFKAAPRRHVTGILQLFRERAAEWPQDARELSIQARTAKGRDLFCRIEHATKGVPDRVCYAEHPSAALSPQRVTRQCVASPLLAIRVPPTWFAKLGKKPPRHSCGKVNNFWGRLST